jgi:CHAT domain-containing protein
MARISCRSLFLPAAVALLAVSATTVRPEVAAYTRASELYAQGRWIEAESFLREALATYGTSDTDAVWGMRAFYGQVLTARTNYAEAVRILSEEPPSRLRNSVIDVRWSSYKAIVLLRVHRPTEATALLDRAEQIARKHQPQVIDEVLKWRANFALNAGRLEAGERYVFEGLQLARRYHHKQAEAELLATLANIRTRLRRYDEAIELGLRALALATELHAASLIQKTEGNLAWAYSLIGDYVSEKMYAEPALALAVQLGAERDGLPWMNQIGDLARLNADYPTALAYYRRAAEIARQQKHADTGEYVANLAVAQLETGDLTNARRSVAEATSLDLQKKDVDEELRAVVIDARIDAADGNFESAIRKAQSVLDRTQTTIRRWEADARLAIFCELAKRPADAEMHFRSAINTAALARRDIKSEELRLPFGALVREVYDDYIAFLLTGRRVVEALNVAELSRAQTLEEALDAEAERKGVDPKRLALKRHAVLLSYWLAPKHSYVWTITPSSIEVAELPPAGTIEQKVDSYANEIVSLHAGDASLIRGAELYKMLVQPVAKRIPKGSRVIIVPDGRLHAFNMETLVDPSTHRYWIENVTIETAGSLELLDRPRTSAPSVSMLLVGDPPSPAPEFPRLTKAAEEMELVNRHFPQSCTTLKGAEATPRAYEKANAGRYAFIHFVTHGFATRQRPLDSAVVLAREGDGYKLYARDIIKHRLRARLVTISSCHGAGLRAYTGEGLVGLAWAFLHAGARQVIAALWEVKDNATPQLMNDMYAGIRANRDPATALRDAKLALIHSGGPYRRPRYWAPFVLYSGS